MSLSVSSSTPVSCGAAAFCGVVVWRWSGVGDGGGAGADADGDVAALMLVWDLAMAGGKSSHVTLLRSFEPKVGLCRLRLWVEGNMVGDEIGLSVW